MERYAMMFGLHVLTLVSCNEPQPTQPYTDLVGVWTGQIDSNPMRIEVTNEHGIIEGTLTWEAGNPVHGTQISELNVGREDSVFMSLVRFGTRATVVTMRGRQIGNVMEGKFTRHAIE